MSIDPTKTPDEIVEAIAGTDDDLMMKYLEDEEITEAELKDAITRMQEVTLETARAIAEWIRADTGQEACDAVEDLLVSLGVPDAGVDILMDIGCPRIKLSYASRA